jgi:hypothetical protein
MTLSPPFVCEEKQSPNCRSSLTWFTLQHVPLQASKRIIFRAGETGIICCPKAAVRPRWRPVWTGGLPGQDPHALKNPLGATKKQRLSIGELKAIE